MNKSNILPYVYYKGEVLKCAGLNIIKNVALKCPIFKFFYDTIITPFKNVDEKIKNENPYMEQIINNIEKKNKEKENKNFEKMFPDFCAKNKTEIEKYKDKDLKDLVGELVERIK